MRLLLRLLLLPFSWLYTAVLSVRNCLYDKDYIGSASFTVPLVAVGNLRVGGTGKTPHVAWLVSELLEQGHHPAILSRGYGRQTTGPRLATAADSAATVGDEPWQYFQEFAGARVPVAVAEQRRLGVALLLRQHPETTVVVLDDAYQHRAVRRTLNLLLSDFAQPFYRDDVLPAGRLRESRAGARRADAVVITKCPPDLPAAARAAITTEVRRYARPDAPVLFSALEYGPAQALLPGTGPPVPAGPAALLTGIARPEPLAQHLAAKGYVLRFHARYSDHHAFRPADIAALRADWQPGWPIFTTAKDATRLLAPALRAAVMGLPLYTIPITVAFLADDAAVLRRLLPAASVGR